MLDLNPSNLLDSKKSPPGWYNALMILASSLLYGPKTVLGVYCTWYRPIPWSRRSL